MKLFYFLIFLFLFHNCSFDKKSGIWNSQEINVKKEESTFKDFEKLSTSNKSFNEIINLEKNFKFNLHKPIKNLEWKDIFFSSSNNFINFKYNDLNKVILKSKKLTRYKTDKYIIFEKNHLVLFDEKGNIIVFSTQEEKIISRFNFYKKKYKNIKKKLNLIVENNLIFVSDNIGYLYAFDFKKNKIIWAKHHKIPFRSNLKLFDNKIVAAAQNNNLYFFNKKSGEIFKMFPTEETVVKNQFINNLSLSGNSLLFLNTYGTLYSISAKTLKVNWFLNLNQSTDLNPSNLFFGSVIVQDKNVIVISANQFTYIIDATTGRLLSKNNFFLNSKPVISNNNLFLITSNNFLISVNLNNFKIVYSQNIDEQIANFLDTKIKKVAIKDVMLVNNKITIFLKNSYIVNFNINGSIEEVRKLPAKINSQPIIINNSILFIDKKNKLIVLD